MSCYARLVVLLLAAAGRHHMPYEIIIFIQQKQNSGKPTKVETFLDNSCNAIQESADVRRQKFLDDMANKYARLLHMNLVTGFATDLTTDLEVCRLPNGRPWVLGVGGCGIVYKVGMTPYKLVLA